MDILFLGSSAFSVPFLDSLYCSVHNIPLVITNADAPAGRGKKLMPNPVKLKAIELGISVMEVSRIDKKLIRSLAFEDLDAAVVVSFGTILPQQFLDIFSGKCINVHPSLLPKYRGPSPITAALENGEKSSGISIMKMDAKMDSGPIYAQTKIAVNEEDTKHSLMEKMVRFGCSLLETSLSLIDENNLEPFLQDEEEATYTSLIDKKELQIKWSVHAEKIANKIRAHSFQPGCYSFFKGHRIKFLKARNAGWEENESTVPGTVVKIDKQEGIFIKCGSKSVLSVDILQPAGKKAITSIEFINGYKLEPGERFE